MKIKFSVTRFASGYVMDEVDDFLEEIECSLLQGGALTDQDVLTKQFSTTRFSEAYVTEDVDVYLDEIVVPWLTGAARYDPKRDYSPALREALRSSAVSPGQAADAAPSEKRPGLLGRVFGTGR